VPTRFLLFTAVGSLDVFVHLAVVWLLFVLSEPCRKLTP